MIYKLIASNSTFIDFGKVGVYISFINHLSRDAKHKDDLNYKVTLKDEFTYRNILSTTALLWQFKRQSGEQTALTKADICRTIIGARIDNDDRIVLSEFPDIDSINFLSHSYLGENENTLQFQHQSFAEILLAEYYLKVFVKYAFEENPNIEDIRILLSVGIPTDQTIEFFKGLLLLLKDASLGSNSNKGILEKRNLFIPLLASLSISENNKLYSTRLDLQWFDKYKSNIYNNNKFPENAVKEFPITKSIFNKLEDVCEKILKSTKLYFFERPSQKTLLYNDELVCTNDIRNSLYDIDKWFALMVGNIIKNDIRKSVFFNSNIDAKILFDMIKNVSNSDYSPYWAREYFIGISMKDNTEVLVYTNLNCTGFNFSNSYLKNLVIQNSSCANSNFNNSVFEFFNLIRTQITYSVFDNITIVENQSEFKYYIPEKLEGEFCLTFCEIAQGVLFPKELNSIIKNIDSGLIDYNTDSIMFDEHLHDKWLDDTLFNLRGIFKYIIKKTGSSKILLSSIKFNENTGTKSLTSKNQKTPKEEFKDFILDIENEIKAHNKV